MIFPLHCFICYLSMRTTTKKKEKKKKHKILKIPLFACFYFYVKVIFVTSFFFLGSCCVLFLFSVFWIYILMNLWKWIEWFSHWKMPYLTGRKWQTFVTSFTRETLLTKWQKYFFSLVKLFLLQFLLFYYFTIIANASLFPGFKC